jgi:GT2 family glycosyltransferase
LVLQPGIGRAGTGKNKNMRLLNTTLIIASRDRPKLLGDTVESVLEGDSIPAEIIIIDQSRNPHPTLSALNTGGDNVIRYMNVTSKGLSRGRNEGIAAARYDMLAIIDDDMYVDLGWFAHLMDALSEGGPQTAVSGQVQPYFGHNQGGFVPSTNVAENPVTYQGRINKDVLFAGNMAIYRSAFDKIGLFNVHLGAGTAFPGAEDSDLGFRLLEAGYTIRFEPKAVVYHRAWRSDGDYLPLRWNYGLGRGAFYANHSSVKDRHMLRRMLIDIKNHLLAFPFHFRHQRRQAYGDLVLSWGILVGFFRWQESARKNRQERND